MPHIHTEPGQIDMTVGVFIVHPESERVLLRYHDKYDMWLVPGGHVELDELPEVAAIREVKEEVGLDVELFSRPMPDVDDPERQSLIVPEYMDIHSISPDHRHIAMIYFATSQTTDTVEPDNHERSRGIRWMAKQELLAAEDIGELIKFYGLQALARLSS